MLKLNDWQGILRGSLIGVILAMVGITVRDWKGWFAIIAINLVCLIRK